MNSSDCSHKRQALSVVGKLTDIQFGMKKYNLIPQFPLVPYFTCLVDEISDNGEFGTTSDIDKIEYNIRLHSDMLNIDIEARSAYYQRGVSLIFPFGPFITILELSLNLKVGTMTFFDFRYPGSKSEFGNQLYGAHFNQNKINEVLKIQTLLEETFSDGDDIVRLLVPPAS